MIGSSGGGRTEVASSGSIGQVDTDVALRLEYRKDELDRQVGFNTDSFFVDTVTIDNPDPGIFGSVSSRFDTMESEVLSATLYDTLWLTEDLSVSFSIKHEQEDLEFAATNFDGTARNSSTGSHIFREQSYRFGSVYSLSKELNLFGVFSKQHDNIRGDSFLRQVNSVDALRPSDILAAEVGVRGSFEEDLFSYSLAFFDIEKEQLLSIDGAGSSESEHSVQGIEAVAQMELWDRVRIGGNFTYYNAEIDQFVDSFSSGNLVFDVEPANVPDRTFDFWAVLQDIAETPIELGASAHYVSSRYANYENSVELKSYSIYNAFAAYSTDRYRIAVAVKNLLDEVYSPWSDLFYPDQLLLGSPRTYEVSAQIRF